MTAQQINQPTERSSEPMRIRRYLVNGKESSKGELAGQPFIVAGADLPEEGTAYGFSQEESFCRWAAGTSHAESFARAIGTPEFLVRAHTQVGARATPARLNAALRQGSGFVGQP